jgi:hypothetical protein
MLQYTIENGSVGGCCGFGQTAVEPSGSCAAPTVTVIKHSAVEAKALGQETWTETRQGMYMALPRTLCMAGWFKGLQRAVNVYAEKNPGVVKNDKIRVDARLGPETLAAVQAIAKAEGQPGPENVDELTMSYAAWSQNISSWSGAPLNVAPEPKPKPEEIQQVVDDETAKKAGMDSGKAGWWSRNWKWVALVALAGGAGYVGYQVYKGREKRGRLPARAARGV